MDPHGCGNKETEKFTEKHFMADGTFVGDISFLRFSYRVSGMGVGICSSHCDFTGLSDSDGDGAGDETAGSLLYDLLHSGMQCRTASDAFAGYRMAYHEDSLSCLWGCVCIDSGWSDDFSGKTFQGRNKEKSTYVKR